MTTKIKTTLLTVFFFFALLTNLQAQDKYEFGVISYSVGFKKIRISTTESFEFKTSENKDPYDFAPVFKILNDMQDKGWEVYQSSSYAVEGVVYFIRKKKN